MRLSICAAAIVFHCCLAVACADHVDNLVEAEMRKNDIPGLVLTVLREGRETKSAAYGLANVELKAPATLETVFEIGSITKQFTAACILLLAQDGKLSIEDPINKHLPSAPAAWSNITVRHLLHHSSGIRSYTGLDGFELSRRLTQRQFIDALAVLPLEFVPGDRWKYSNSGYNLLGFIIENASGQPYWAFLAGRIFGPLQLASATNRDPAIIVPRRASGYLRKDGGLINRDSDLTDVFSAGAIVATVGDLAKWNAALESGRLLNAASTAQMWTRGRLNNGTDGPYGFGWRLGEFRGRKNIGHSGSTSGFSASLQRFPDERLTVIVLCNSGEVNIATTLARTIAALYFDPAQTDPP